jgi:hypothetical protein
MIAVYDDPFGMGKVQIDSYDGLAQVVIAAGFGFDVNHFYAFAMKPFSKGECTSGHGEDHIPASALPSLSEREATHHVSSTGRDSGISPN